MMQVPDVATLHRYVRLIGDVLSPAPALELSCEDESTIQVERGLVLPMALAGADAARLDESVARLVSAPSSPARARVTDASGHRRAAYDGLLAYAWQLAFTVAEDRLPAPRADAWRRALRAWCAVLQVRHVRASRALLSIPAAHAPAAAGAALTGCAWAALASHAIGSDASARRVFPWLVARQQPGGAFLAPGGGDNPETRWYHELVLLHACFSYAVARRDDGVLNAALRAARHHAAEIQPDHASGQPWGLGAFICINEGRPYADELLHAVRVQADGVSQVLLADTLLTLSQLIARGGEP